ncbi:trypsin-like peptidase domain-containing protein [Candidatus Pacearchaeota archaeon]|nr:trypsin-like peptidase domain-containing protein [Candidatus Pacearchaeota archaeon]
MTLKRHHKIILSGFTSVIVIFMIVSSIFLYSLFIKQNLEYNSLNNKISKLDEDTQNKINVIAESLIQTQELAEESQEALQLEMNLLKASAGEDFSGIIEDAVKSVVIIKTSGLGTGFIISDDGYVVTNYHVIEGEIPIQAITYGQDTMNADIIGYNEHFDVALLKISGSYNRLRFGDSDDTQIAEKVITIGHPRGLFFSVTSGIVSGVHRKGINSAEAYVQIDAPLNPGNSGGPLINTKGKVIGINNFKVAEGESLGFALESNYLKNIINEISGQTLIS